VLEVLEPGLLSTIQDSGRPGYGHLGVAHSGAADDHASAVANFLLGNDRNASVLEMTLLGGSFAVGQDTLVSITGANMEAHVPEEERPLPAGQRHRLRAGSTLVFSGAIDGARTYLALPGGIEAQKVLGSTSTDPIAGFGGIDGRSLQPGDRLSARSASPIDERAPSWPADRPSSGVLVGSAERIVAVVRGPHYEQLASAIGPTLTEVLWTVTPRSNRVGMRLSGPPIETAAALDLVSLPMVPGAIQVPANGQPIVLMPDAPTVGGYPVPAVVCEVDRCILAQLRPGDELRFEWTAEAVARRRLSERRKWFEGSPR
jgi:biotin-dependent carboxylase-like uncharacterized protein